VGGHAGATRVGVNLNKRVSRLLLEIADGGKEITAKQVSDRNSLSLLGMRKRAAFLGGEPQINRQPGRGTPVTVSIPLRREGDTTWQSQMTEDGVQPLEDALATGVE